MFSHSDWPYGEALHSFLTFEYINHFQLSLREALNILIKFLQVSFKKKKKKRWLSRQLNNNL